LLHDLRQNPFMKSSEHWPHETCSAQVYWSSGATSEQEGAGPPQRQQDLSQNPFMKSQEHLPQEACCAHVY